MCDLTESSEIDWCLGNEAGIDSEPIDRKTLSKSSYVDGSGSVCVGRSSVERSTAIAEYVTGARMEICRDKLR